MSKHYYLSNIKYLCKERDITEKQLYDELGISDTVVSKIEKGYRKAEEVERICRWFGITREDLFLIDLRKPLIERAIDASWVARELIKDITKKTINGEANWHLKSEGYAGMVRSQYRGMRNSSIKLVFSLIEDGYTLYLCSSDKLIRNEVIPDLVITTYSDSFLLVQLDSDRGQCFDIDVGNTGRLYRLVLRSNNIVGVEPKYDYYGEKEKPHEDQEESQDTVLETGDNFMKEMLDWTENIESQLSQDDSPAIPYDDRGLTSEELSEELARELFNRLKHS